MNVHTIAAQIHGRYLIHSPTDQAAGTLCGFHGYKENADIQMRALQRIAGDRPWRLVSVEALHRFYSKGGEVVASWMTKQDRELAIADNVAYVAAVLSEIAEESGAARPIVYAGFSQGVGMAYRAAAFAGRPCDGLIVLGGDVPPDVAPVAAQLPKILLGRGTKDEWYTEDKASRDLDVLRAAGTDVVEYVFEGGHDWHDSFVARAGEFLDRTFQNLSEPF
jgi:predicted esterase